jgi:putative membrane protein insertion efficiency factor
MKFLLLKVIAFYRLAVSPHFRPVCKFEPTCSKYAQDAIIKHGAAKGFFMAVWRVLRCNPFSKGGYDPVE